MGRNLWPRRLFFSTIGLSAFGKPDWKNELLEIQGDPPFSPCGWTWTKNDQADASFTWTLTVSNVDDLANFSFVPTVSSLATGVVGYGPATLVALPLSVTPFRLAARVYGPNRLVFPFLPNPLWVIVSEEPEP